MCIYSFNQTRMLRVCWRAGMTVSPIYIRNDCSASMYEYVYTYTHKRIDTYISYMNMICICVSNAVCIHMHIRISTCI